MSRKTMQRPSGFYRVKDDGQWSIAQYDDHSGIWASLGEGGNCYDDSWEEIDPEPIPMPANDA